MVHIIEKPEKIAALGAAFLEQSLTLPKLFSRKSFDEYAGAQDDVINHVIEGVLPYRTYGWRSDRAQPIQWDEYAEKKVQVGFSADVPYSGVRLTDEQAKMDTDGWAKLTRKQGEAIGKGLNHEAAAYIRGLGSVVGGHPGFDYAVKVGVPNYDLRWGLNKAKLVFDRLANGIGGPRTMVVGTGWEEAILNDEKLTFANIVGESEAVGALREATLGRRSGIDFVVDLTLDEDEAYLFVPSAFTWLVAAPAVPRSVPAGALGSSEGVPVRWLQDYDTEYFRDRSVFNNWSGFKPVTDRLVGFDRSQKQGVVGDYDHFVRGIKLTLTESKEDADTATTVPVATSGTSEAAKRATELANLTGIKPWTARTVEQAHPAMNVTVINEAPTGEDA